MDDNSGVTSSKCLGYWTYIYFTFSNNHNILINHNEWVPTSICHNFLLNNSKNNYYICSLMTRKFTNYIVFSLWSRKHFWGYNRYPSLPYSYTTGQWVLYKQRQIGNTLWEPDVNISIEHGWSKFWIYDLTVY